MLEFRRIICPVDASDCSLGALRAALELAERFDVRVDVLHTYHVPAYVQPGVLVWAAVGPRPLWQLAEEQARSEIERFLSRLAPGARSRIDVLLEVGEPGVTIVEAVQRRGADLVVMGTHGRTGARRMVLGSVAERVVRLSPCPVLVIPLGTAAEESAKSHPTGHANEPISVPPSEGAST